MVSNAAKRAGQGAESDRQGVPMLLHPADVAEKQARASEDTGAPRVEGTASPRRAHVHTETTLSVVATERAAAAKLAPLPKEHGAPKVRKRQALLPKDLLQSLRRDFVEACASHGLSIDHLTVPPLFLCPRRTRYCRVAGTLAASISSMKVATWSITTYGTCRPLALARRSESAANTTACDSLGSGTLVPASLGRHRNLRMARGLGHHSVNSSSDKLLYVAC